MSKHSQLFETPLAERMRPQQFSDFIGQEDIIGQGKILRKLIENDQLSSLIFWGPPGVGKTTLAQIIAAQTKSYFALLSAVSSGKEELMKIIKQAKELLAEKNQRTILFIDEIHRWNKAQQDALLPVVEKGIVILIGATTENPSFEIIGALLSRSRVFILKYLTEADIVHIIKNALVDKDRGLGNIKISMDKKTIELLAELAGGDARVALNGLELAVKAKSVASLPLSKREIKRELPERSAPTPPTPSRAEGEKIVVTADDIKEALQRTHLVFDKNGEEFYNLISALHKSMRGSNADAALYWLARMLEGGADPLYIARRVVRFASEDIGMANSEALVQANAAFSACHTIGMPECSVHLAQAVVYCAKSTKSNLLYTAYSEAAKDAKNTSHLGVPIHLCNAPTKFMKNISYGKDYKYSPKFDYKEDQEYFPPELNGKRYLAKK